MGGGGLKMTASQSLFLALHLRCWGCVCSSFVMRCTDIPENNGEQRRSSGVSINPSLKYVNFNLPTHYTMWIQKKKKIHLSKTQKAVTHCMGEANVTYGHTLHTHSRMQCTIILRHVLKVEREKSRKSRYHYHIVHRLYHNSWRVN